MQRRKTESRRYYCFREGRALAIFIRRKIWEGTEKEPKTEARKAPIPIIPHLKKIIEQYRTSNGSPTTGWAFTASRGKKPTRMDNLARREIKPDLEKAKIAWHGWHAFRKSLGHQSL